jgi:hypothetical protein
VRGISLTLVRRERTALWRAAGSSRSSTVMAVVGNVAVLVVLVVAATCTGDGGAHVCGLFSSWMESSEEREEKDARESLRPEGRRRSGGGGVTARMLVCVGRRMERLTTSGIGGGFGQERRELLCERERERDRSALRA